MKKKFLLAICLVLLTGSAAGCSSDKKNDNEGRLASAMKQRSGINNDSSYMNYIMDLTAGNIRDGYYYDENSPVYPDGQDSPVISGKARISVSGNSRLNVRYFLDRNHEFEISSPSQNFIYLEPGEEIYAEADVNPENAAGSYAFSEFRVYSYVNGSRTLLSSGYDRKTGLVWKVPDNCDGLEINIEPVGKYLSRTVTFSDYFCDDMFRRTDISDEDGKWILNGSEVSGNTAEADSLGSCQVSYEYDSGKYFFVSSEPKYLLRDDNRIMFSRVSAADDISEYRVELHPFIETVLTAESNTKAEVNGVPAGTYAKGQNITLKNLRFGDTIVLTCSKKENIVYDKNVLTMTKSDDTFGIYTFTVKEPSDDFTFDPSSFRYEHGKIQFRYLGNVISEKISLSAGRQIEYSALSADEGYWLPDGENIITVSDNPDETLKALESIRFYEKKLVTVTFPQPASGGRITYKKNERTIMNDTEKMLSGTVIRMKFTPWNGWTLPDTLPDSFIVSDESDTQTVSFTGTDISSIFTEIDEHKPHLKVTADRQTGSDIKFNIRTSDISQSDLSWNRKENVLLDTETGTADGIIISASGKLPKDQVLKITVEKLDDSGTNHTEICYLNELPAEKKTEIYSSGDLDSHEISIKDINIKITAVDKLVYEPAAYENARFSLRFADTESKESLSTGDITDRDRIVTVTLKPSGSYYISGEGVQNDVYQAKMKYSEFLANADKINKSYPRKKICTLDLNTADSYGKVVYTLNGNEISGTAEVREDDELIISYTLENKDFIIYKDFISAMHDLLSNSPYEKSMQIKVTPDMDGTSVTREDYITVQKKEK